MSSLFIQSENENDYYAVTFEQSLSIDSTQGIIPVESEKNKKVVILINPLDGSSKEASWVKSPVKYLLVSEDDAKALVVNHLKTADISWDDRDVARVEMVYRESTPYYLQWKVTIHNEVFFVGQDGRVDS